MYTAVVRALHYIIPQDHPSDTLALALFFSFRPLLYLCTPFAPENLRHLNDSDSSSSETSDSENRPRHAEKVKCYVLICIKSLFRTNSMQLFKHWAYLFPDSQKGSVRERALKTPSVLYLMFVEKSVKVRVNAIDTICGVLEHSPLSAWKGSADVNKAGGSFTPFSSEISQIISNLHDAVAQLITEEDNQQIAISLLKLGESLISNTPYQTLNPGLLTPVCTSAMKWLTSGDTLVRQATLSLLTVGFTARPTDLQPLLSYESLTTALFPLSPSEELLPERLSLLSKVGKSLPQCLFDHMHWVKTTLPLFTTSQDTKISAQGFSVISEHISANPTSPLSEWVLGQWLEQLPSDSLDVLGQCFNAIAAFPSLSLLNDQQRKVLQTAVANFKVKSVGPATFKVALLKIVSRLILTATDEFLWTLYDITFLYRTDLNLSVALGVSQALVEMASHPGIHPRIADFVECLIERSENKKEKIVSGAVAGLGLLVKSRGFSMLETNQLERLFQSILKNVGHKNAKVGWDACDALQILIESPDFRRYPVHATVLPALLSFIETHYNYKTRISCCSMLPSLKPEIRVQICSVAKCLLSVLETDLTHEPEDFAQGKHQHTFRLSLAQTVVELLCELSREASGLAEFLSTYSHAVLEAIKSVLVDVVHSSTPAGMASNPVSQMCKEAARTVHTLIEADPEIHVSFAMVDRLDELSRFDRETLQWVLGYSEASEDCDIGLKSDRTPNSPSHRSSEKQFT